MKNCLLEMSDSCIDWKLCVKCQKRTSEDLRCPIQDHCLFFDDDLKSEHLHDFTTFNSDVSVNVMATQMSDTS